MRCIFGHKWNYYTDRIETTITTSYTNKEYIVLTKKDFRVCDRCSQKEIKNNKSGNNSNWSKYNLNNKN
jgi:hypothetical protein